MATETKGIIANAVYTPVLAGGTAAVSPTTIKGVWASSDLFVDRGWIWNGYHRITLVNAQPSGGSNSTYVQVDNIRDTKKRDIAIQNPTDSSTIYNIGDGFKDLGEKLDLSDLATTTTRVQDYYAKFITGAQDNIPEFKLFSTEQDVVINPTRVSCIKTCCKKGALRVASLIAKTTKGVFNIFRNHPRKILGAAFIASSIAVGHLLAKAKFSL